MNDALYDAVAFGMRYWFLLLIALMLFTLIGVSVAEYKRHKSIMNMVGTYVGYLETEPTEDEPALRFGIAKGTVIGSGKRADIIIDDPEVSKTHAVILRRGNKTAISPSGGSEYFLNGCRYDRPCRIYSGDVLVFGSVRMRVFLKEEQTDDA